MKINYFEEFPTRRSLQKAKWVNSGSIVFLAARDLKEYQKAKDLLLLVNPGVKAGYWKIFKGTYWLSAFTNIKEVDRFQKEVKGLKDPVLLDLEIPLPKVIFRNLLNLATAKKVRKKINEICKSNNVFTYEYLLGKSLRPLLVLLAVRSESPQERKIYGFYDLPFFGFLNYFKLKNLRGLSQQGANVGIGTMGQGVIGVERDISKEELARRLALVSRFGIKGIFVFRLGGLTQDYLKVINKFASKKPVIKV